MAVKFELTRDFIDLLKTQIKEGDKLFPVQMLQDLHPADIAEIIENLTLEEANYLYPLLDAELAADILLELEDDVREKLVETIPSEVIARDLIDNMDSDDAADIIGDLPEEKKSEVLQQIDDVEQAVDIVDLLNYDEDTAGGLMAKELISVNINWDINTCIREMRKQSEEVEELYYVYVVDDDGLLMGTVSLKRIILARSNAKIKNILNDDIRSVTTETTSEEVAIVMEKYDLVALPVVDAIGRLVGRITIDDVVDVIKEEAEKDYQLASGLTSEVEPSDTVFTSVKARVPWLFIGLMGGIIGAKFLSGFEGHLKEAGLLLFLPLIAAMGGNVGVQSSSIVVQALAQKSVDIDSAWKKIVKELSVAFIAAALFAIIIWIVNHFWMGDAKLTIAVSISLFAVMLFASIFGTVVPLVLNRFKIDPAIATGPFITTSNDILGIVMYAAISKVIFTMM